jgi:hypothetical protein
MDTVFTTKPPPEFLPEQPPPTKAIHNVYKLKKQPELIWYLHAAVGFPTKPTWIKVIKNKQFVSWPGLTTKAIAKHYSESEETFKGQGLKIRSELQSTRASNKVHMIKPEQENINTHLAELNKWHHSIYFEIYDAEEEAVQTIHIDQTGQFPKKSSRGNQYIMVLCDIDDDLGLLRPDPWGI